mmetsp:Transcript_22889/g.48413  ORF Transcript_22889/g.48413 Transcript_22889/m.48413 type:complete len:208 (-) Transcript_22889:993-1616(-)
MASKTRAKRATTCWLTAAWSTFGLIPTEVVLMSTLPAASLEDSRSSRDMASHPSSLASACALERVRLAMVTRAPREMAPKASARAVPPDPRMHTRCPSRPDPDPPSTAASFASMAEIAATQSVLLARSALSSPEEEEEEATMVLIAPICCATGSTSAQYPATCSLWGIVMLQPASLWATKVSMKSSMSVTRKGRYTASTPSASKAAL